MRVAVPLSDFGIEGRGDVTAFWVQNQSSGAATFYLDDISFRTTAPGTVPEETLAAKPAAP